MKIFLRSVLGAVAILAAGVTSSAANDRYADRPPVMVSPDLSAPWVLQLGRAPGIVRQSRQVIAAAAPCAMRSRRDPTGCAPLPCRRRPSAW